MTSGLRSGQVAAAAGVNPQTLRYYERRGLLAEPDRTFGGHRIYPAETVTLLQVIKTAQRLGFTLDEVADLLAARSHRHRRRGTDAGLPARVAAKLAAIEQQVADLGVIRQTLRAAVAAGCEDLITCAQSPCCPLPFTEPTRAARPEPGAMTGWGPSTTYSRPMRRTPNASPMSAGQAGRPEALPS